MSDGTTVDTTTTDTTATTDTTQTVDTTVDTTTTTTTTDTTDTTGTVDKPAFDFEKDWRSALSKGDTDLLKFLGRYQSPDSAIKKFKEINDELKSGKYRKPLGEDPSDEELAAYRKDNGVPDKADGYLESLPEGLVVGDDDKPYVDQFLTAMHGLNAPPQFVNAALDTYYKVAQEQAQEQAEVDHASDQQCVDTLREEWGADFRRNQNVLNSYLATLPAEVADAIKGGRDNNGVPLSMNPVLLKWLTSEALEKNPLATVVPGAGANQAQAIADEMAEIEKVMRTDRGRYNKDQKMQERYRQLIDAKLKIG